MPALWLVSDTLPWLFALQILGGVLWAAFELATLLSFFDQIPESARTSLLAVYNLAYGAAVALGTAVGGAILAYGGSTPLAYAAVMAVSAGSRLVSLRLLRQVTDVPPGEMPMPRMRTLGVRPSSGALQRPVVSALDAPEDAMPARVAPTRPPRA